MTAEVDIDIMRGSFTMTGGTISGNTADEGNDVYTDTDSVFLSLLPERVNAPANATLVCAIYGANGQMTGVQVAPLAGGCSDKPLAQLLKTVPSDETHYKLFLLGSDYASLCGAYDSSQNN